jgi:hypothetical protein
MHTTKHACGSKINEVGGISRVIIPPSLGCQNTSNESILLSIQRYIQLDSL